MTTPHANPDENKREEILQRVDQDGRRIYDHARRDPFSGQWYGRRVGDHTREDRIA